VREYHCIYDRAVLSCHQSRQAQGAEASKENLMSSEIIVALVVVVLFIGSLALIEIHSRRSHVKAEKVAEAEGLNRNQEQV